MSCQLVYTTSAFQPQEAYWEQKKNNWKEELVTHLEKELMKEKKKLEKDSHVYFCSDQKVFWETYCQIHQVPSFVNVLCPIK